MSVKAANPTIKKGFSMSEKAWIIVGEKSVKKILMMGVNRSNSQDPNIIKQALSKKVWTR